MTGADWAMVAAFVSYRHALQVVRAHGESGGAGAGLPGHRRWADLLRVDGAAERRSSGRQAALAGLRRAGAGHRRHPGRERGAGLSFGPVGALVASWPAPALVISYELLMIVLRTSPRAAATAPAADTAVPDPPAGLNGHGHAAAERYAAELARGEVPGYGVSAGICEWASRAPSRYGSTWTGSPGLAAGRPARRGVKRDPQAQVGRRLRRYLRGSPPAWLLGWVAAGVAGCGPGHCSLRLFPAPRLGSRSRCQFVGAAQPSS